MVDHERHTFKSVVTYRLDVCSSEFLYSVCVLQVLANSGTVTQFAINLSNTPNRHVLAMA